MGGVKGQAALADENAWGDLVVQNIVNWRTIRGYGRQWRESSDWIGHPSR
jgi:hypothetical protein